MKKTILISLFILSFAMLGGAFYFYKSNDVTERRSRLMKHVKKELKNKALPTNSFDEKIEREQYNISKRDYTIYLAEKAQFSKCLSQTNLTYTSEGEATKCSNSLNTMIINRIGEEAFVKAIAYTYITSGRQSLTLGSDILISRYKEAMDENNNYLKLISFSGFLYNLREPQKLASFYKKYKPLLKDFITKELYDEHFIFIVDGLLEAHQKLENIEDKTLFIEQVRDKASETYTHSHFENWSITFWDRRNFENNDTVIYNILRDIKSIYNPE